MSNIGVIIFFILTAVFGLILMSYVVRGQKRPMYLVALHGILAIASYGTLSYNVGVKVREESLGYGNYPLENYAYVFFSIGAVIGLFMLVRDKLLDKGLPKWIPFVHASFNVIGLVILIIATIINK